VRLTSLIASGLRSVVFPGLDLHTRSRAALCRYWKHGDRDVLGCRQWERIISPGWRIAPGARVVAINIVADQVARSKSLLVDYRGADPQRLQFEVRNLYDLASESRRFDEIICYETLEHVRNDQDVCRKFLSAVEARRRAASVLSLSAAPKTPGRALG